MQDINTSSLIPDIPSADPTHVITFHEIRCDLPSAGINIKAADAAIVAGDMVATIGKGAQAVATLAGPEAKAAAVVVQVAGKVTSATAKLTKLIDKKIRERGKLPDQFYISQTSPKTPTSGEIKEYQVKWPKADSNPRKHHEELAAGDRVTKKISFDAREGRAVVLWDWDKRNKDKGSNDKNKTRDDILLLIPIEDARIGRHANVYYNALQDCTYYVDWELRAK